MKIFFSVVYSSFVGASVGATVGAAVGAAIDAFTDGFLGLVEDWCFLRVELVLDSSDTFGSKSSCQWVVCIAVSLSGFRASSTANLRDEEVNSINGRIAKSTQKSMDELPNLPRKSMDELPNFPRGMNWRFAKFPQRNKWKKCVILQGNQFEEI